jgi:His-Xaa-Ser system radical SAM maturase HxsC
MCSQPPKKTHHDRFEWLRQACHLAEPGSTIGITGGEPTLYREPLLEMIEDVLGARPDLSFHVLTNGQHFGREEALRLRRSEYRRVVWGMPLYSADPGMHDEIVGKAGAFERLHESFEHLLLAGARIELRTVLTRDTVQTLVRLARHVTTVLSHVEQWSLMGLENIGYARRRWDWLHVDLRQNFTEVGRACDLATLRGLPPRLFNVPLCHVPEAFRHLAVASISDWKQRFAPACAGCRAQSDCSGFFEWHPEQLLDEVIPL